MWGAYAIGLLSSLFCYLYLRCESFISTEDFSFAHMICSVTAPSYNADGQYTAPMLLFSFFIGLVCSMSIFFLELSS